MSESAWVELLLAGMRLAVPILLAALGEIVVERTGVVNIGIEGMMLTGALAAALAAHATGAALPGLVAGVLAGMLLALVFAGVAIAGRGDAIVTGTGVNLLALGVTGFVYEAAFGRTGGVLQVVRLEALRLPGLAAIPVVGRVFFDQPVTAYMAYIVAALIFVLFAHTGLGFRLRAAGEAPRAAEAAGASVALLRTGALLFGGAMAGLGGAALVVAHAGTFVEGMTAGRGFIALAMVIFARCRPGAAVATSLLFGVALALQFEIQALGLAIPYQLARMFPYLATLAVLAFSALRGRAGARDPFVD